MRATAVEGEELVSLVRGRKSNSHLTLKECVAWQHAFLEEVPGLESSIAAFQDVPNVLFFIKDLESRFIYVSPPLALRLGYSDPDHAILSRDCDYGPPALADRFVRDDREVFTNGKPLRNFREPLFHPLEGFCWAISSKWPIHDSSGEVIGLTGVTRKEDPAGNGEDKNFGLLIQPGIDRLTEYIVENLDRTLSNEEMASFCGLSVRQLVRRLNDTHGLTPRHFASFTRIQLACRCLAETDNSILEIALEHGFANQSFFSTQFKKFIGITPRQFRTRWKNGT